MAFEQNFEEPTSLYDCDDDLSLKEKWQSNSDTKPAAESADGCFECNICLDSAHDPVVTLCGHLYCWPCIYKWLRVQSSAPDTGGQPRCPVCKANISFASLVPLYGRSNSAESGTKRPNLGIIVPRRPTSCDLHTPIANITTSASTTPQANQAFHQHQYFAQPQGSYGTPGSSTPGSMGMPSALSPTAGMFGGLVYAQIFGTPDTSLLTYPYANPYQLAGGSSPRMRRQELQADKSLSRVSLFLFCCFVLCLVLF